mgnify:CR=1 FL=1
MVNTINKAVGEIIAESGAQGVLDYVRKKLEAKGYNLNIGDESDLMGLIADIVQTVCVTPGDYSSIDWLCSAIDFIASAPYGNIAEALELLDTYLKHNHRPDEAKSLVRDIAVITNGLINEAEKCGGNIDEA